MSTWHGNCALYLHDPDFPTEPLGYLGPKERMMNSKVVIPHGKSVFGGSTVVTAAKVLVLVAVTWGVVFPALFWSFSRLIN